MEINPLIGIPSPRTIPEFMHHIAKIKRFDKFWAINFYEPQAYRAIRNFFLAHEEYTHLVLVPDDILITNDDIDILLRDLEEYDYQVLGGVCNVTWLQRDVMSPCRLLPGDTIETYVWITRAEIDYWRRLEHYILGVAFDGFALSFLRRDVVERVPFRGEWATDGNFSNDLHKADIPTFIDIRCEVFHMKYRAGYSVYEFKREAANEPREQVFFEPKKS